MAMNREVQLELVGHPHTSRWKGGSKAAVQSWYVKHGRKNYYENHEAQLATKKRYRDKVRQEVLEAYGRKCACCGESEEMFLALDHVNGRDTTAPRSRRAGTGLYKQARDAGFPASYQLLCHNCNCAKGYYGSCPHKKVR